MKVRHLIGATAVSCLLLGALATPAFADTAATGASVTGGALTATLAGPVTFPAVAASHTDTASAAPATSVDVNDLTSTGAGWGVTIAATDLTGALAAAANDIIPAANVSLTAIDAPAGVTPPGGAAPSPTGVAAGTPGAIGTAITLVSAAAGDGVGEYTDGFTLGVVVPADSLADSYTGSVTVTATPLS